MVKKKIKHEYKKTKIGLIPEDWILGQFNDLAIIEMGQSPDGNSYNDSGVGIPLINGPTEFSDRFPVKLQWTSAPTKICRPGDILFCVRGSSTGRINISDDDYCIGRGIAAIRNRNNGDIAYIEHLLMNVTEKILKLTSGSTFPNIDKKNLSSIDIPLPPLPEQKKIAEILSTWDRAIEKTEKLIDAKTKLKKGLMQQLLTQKKKLNNGKNDWSKVKIKDIFDRITTKNSVNNQNILTVSAQQGFIKQNLFFNKRIASELLHDYFLVEKGDFVYNKSYSNGYPLGAIKHLNDSDSGVVTTLYICFRKKESDLTSPEFYEHYFEAGLINESLTRVAHEGGRAHGLLNITPTDFFNIEIDYPPIEEQQQIAAILSTANKEITTLNKKLNALKLQKKGLMQKLLTGEVRVKV